MEEPKFSSISPKNLKLIADTIKDPYNSTANIKIRLGKPTLFHVDKQKLLVDKLNLSPAPKQEQNLSLEQKLEQLGKTVEQLGKTVEQQQNQIEQLERKLESKLNFIAMNNTKLKNQKLGNWISNFGSKLYQAWNNVKSTIKNFIDSRVQKATEKVAAVSAGFLEKSVNYILNKYGREEKPGILSVQGELYSYSKNIDSGEISITSNSTKNNIVEKGNFTAKASPEDITLLKTLPEKVKSSIAQDQTQTQEKDRGISR